MAKSYTWSASPFRKSPRHYQCVTQTGILIGAVRRIRVGVWDAIFCSPGEADREIPPQGVKLTVAMRAVEKYYEVHHVGTH